MSPSAFLLVADSRAPAAMSLLRMDGRRNFVAYSRGVRGEGGS